MTRIESRDRSAFSEFEVGAGVRLVQVRIEVIDPPNRKPYRRIGPVYRIDPPGTCPICFGRGGCDWFVETDIAVWLPCWHCVPADSNLESTSDVPRP